MSVLIIATNGRVCRTRVGRTRQIAAFSGGPQRKILRAVVFLALAFAGGCRQSLFDSHGATSGAGPDAPIGPASTCPAPCIGDSAGDFDGTANGKTGRWRYLDDHRDRTWAPMAATDEGFVGANSANTVRECAVHRDVEACQMLPNALLVSTAGFTPPPGAIGADPAIEFTAEANRTLELQLSVYVPTGGFGQTVRIYRNSREDVLFTGMAPPGTVFNHSITLDALAGDRFVVAIAPPALGQPDIAVRLYVVGANATFPTECQFAIPFAALSGLTTNDACRGAKLTAMHDATAGTPTPALAAGPFPELGTAASMTQHNFYGASNILERPGDVTIDLWVKVTMPVSPASTAWVYSEQNTGYQRGGGLTIDISSDNGAFKIYAETIHTDVPGSVIYVSAVADYPSDQNWHFVRAVHKTGGAIKLCVDGVFKAMIDAPGTLKPFTAPYIGQIAFAPQDPGHPVAFVGTVDDVRVLNTALPCE